jgi:hypothetical protein
MSRPKRNLPNPHGADQKRLKAIDALRDYHLELRGIVSHVEIVLDTLSLDDEHREERHG